VSLTDAGEEIDSSTRLNLFLPDARESSEPKSRTRGKGMSSSIPISRSPRQKSLSEEVEVVFSPQEIDLEKKLRVWRLEEAKKNGCPAFRIFGDKTLRGIVLERPRTLDDLLRVDGIGPEKASRFGASICAICSDPL
jgi:ATP-dependent DNA helicase RecQ